MRNELGRWFRGQKSQGMTEFAIIAPVILLLTFGIIDFGRGLYFYITLQQAANEGARVAVRASDFTDPNGGTHNWPNNTDVALAVQAHAVTENLANPCPNGPIPNGGNPGVTSAAAVEHGLDLHHRPQPRRRNGLNINGTRGCRRQTGLGTTPPGHWLPHHSGRQRADQSHALV